MKKTLFHTFAKKSGFLVPKTHLVKKRSDLRGLSRNLEFPCIIKPFERTKKWNERFYKVIKISSRADFNENISGVLDTIDAVVIQEWIEGSDSDIYFCLVYFDKKSDPKATFVGRKIRQWPPEYGTTASAEKKFNQTVLDETVRLFKELGFRGLGSVEYKYDHRDQKFKIMEPTVGRPNLQSYLAVANGINIPYITYCDLVGDKIEKFDEPSFYNSVNWINDFSEYQAVYYYIYNKTLKLTSWLKFLKGPKKFALLNIRDPLPFIFTLKNWIKYLIKKSPVYRIKPIHMAIKVFKKFMKHANGKI